MRKLKPRQWWFVQTKVRAGTELRFSIFQSNFTSAIPLTSIDPKLSSSAFDKEEILSESFMILSEGKSIIFPSIHLCISCSEDILWIKIAFLPNSWKYHLIVFFPWRCKLNTCSIKVVAESLPIWNVPCLIKYLIPIICCF